MPIEACEPREGMRNGFLQMSGYEEPRLHDLSADIVEAQLSDKQTHAQEGQLLLGDIECGHSQGRLLEDGPGPSGPTRYDADLALRPTVQVLKNLKDLEPNPMRPNSGHYGPVFNNSGINLEVVLEDTLVNNTSEIPGNMFGDFSSGRILQGGGISTTGSHIGMRHHFPASDSTDQAEVAIVADAGNTTAGAEQALNIGVDSSLPHRRGVVSCLLCDLRRKDVQGVCFGNFGWQIFIVGGVDFAVMDAVSSLRAVFLMQLEDGSIPSMVLLLAVYPVHFDHLQLGLGLGAGLAFLGAPDLVFHASVFLLLFAVCMVGSTELSFYGYLGGLLRGLSVSHRFGVALWCGGFKGLVWCFAGFRRVEVLGASSSRSSFYRRWIRLRHMGFM
ncbi:hypothetical protein Dimus_006395 [Dionaea muscipula]